MELEAVGIAVLGFMLGPLSLIAHHWVADRISGHNPDTDLRTNRGQAQFLLAGIAAVVAMAAVVLFGIWVFGLYPLYYRGPLLFSSWLVGALVFSFGVRLFHHIRGLLNARDGDS